jgi:hypothetical protein
LITEPDPPLMTTPFATPLIVPLLWLVTAPPEPRLTPVLFVPVPVIPPELVTEFVAALPPPM